MSDPLGLINSASNVNPAAFPLPGVGAVRNVPTNADGSSFKDLLMKNINEVNQLQQEATTAIEDLSTGKRSDLEGVLLATQKADTAFKMLLSVRNKVQQAYEEIKQLRV